VKIDIGNFPLKFVDTFYFWLKSDKNKGTPCMKAQECTNFQKAYQPPQNSRRQ